jgi:hypothetical protein
MRSHDLTLMRLVYWAEARASAQYRERVRGRGMLRETWRVRPASIPALDAVWWPPLGRSPSVPHAPAPNRERATVTGGRWMGHEARCIQIQRL